MVGPLTDVTGTLSTLRERWGAGIVRQGFGVVGSTTSRPVRVGRDAAVSMGALALAPLPDPDGPAGTPDIEPDATRTSTGFRALDGLIGGLPRQGTVAIVGGPSSGATTLTLRAVAEAQATGAIAAWLDLPGRFDPLEAAERGVDLRWLVVVRPPGQRTGCASWARCWPAGPSTCWCWTCRHGCPPARPAWSASSPRRPGGSAGGCWPSAPGA